MPRRPSSPPSPSSVGVAGYTGYIGFAFLGAAAVSVLVYAVGGGRGATPARLALAGTALNAALISYVSAVQLLDTASLDRMRFWMVGSLARAQDTTVLSALPFIAVGALIALALARPLNALALGDDAPAPSAPGPPGPAPPPSWPSPCCAAPPPPPAGRSSSSD